MQPDNILKGIEDEQARLGEGIEANRAALDDADAKFNFVYRSMTDLQKTMVSLFSFVSFRLESCSVQRRILDASEDIRQSVEERLEHVCPNINGVYSKLLEVYRE